MLDAEKKCPLANEPQNSSVFVTTCGEFCVEDLIQNTFQIPTNLILCGACEHCSVGRPAVFKISCVCVCLFIFFTAQSNVTDSVLEVVACEARRLFRDRLVSLKDIHTFDNILSSIIRGDWGSDALDNMTGSRQFYSH